MPARSWEFPLALDRRSDQPQYLQLVHAAEKPDILNVSTLAVLDNAARLGVLAHSEADVLRSAARQ